MTDEPMIEELERLGLCNLRSDGRFGHHRKPHPWEATKCLGWKPEAQYVVEMRRERDSLLSDLKAAREALEGVLERHQAHPAHSGDKEMRGCTCGYSFAKCPTRAIIVPVLAALASPDKETS